MAGRPKKPSRLKELNGSAKHDPQRVNRDEPVPTGGIGDPPEYLTRIHKKIWREFVGQSAPGVLTISDRTTLELAAVLMAKFRKYAYNDGLFTAGEQAQLFKCLSHMGMTPSDRSKIIVPKDPAAKNKFSNLAGGKDKAPPPPVNPEPTGNADNGQPEPARA